MDDYAVDAVREHLPLEQDDEKEFFRAQPARKILSDLLDVIVVQKSCLMNFGEWAALRATCPFKGSDIPFNGLPSFIEHSEGTLRISSAASSTFAVTAADADDESRQYIVPCDLAPVTAEEARGSFALMSRYLRHPRLSAEQRQEFAAFVALVEAENAAMEIFERATCAVH